MKKIYFLVLFLMSILIKIQAQTTADKFSIAMDAYNSHQFAIANKLFQKFFLEHHLSDELYATAKYYSSESLLNLGEKNAAAAGFEYLINNFMWSKYRDKSLYNLGLIYFQTNQYNESADRLKLLINDYPYSSFSGIAYYWIGEDYFKAGKLENAITFFKNSIKNNPNNHYLDYTIFALANLYEKMGDLKNAIKYYDNLLSYHSDSPLANDAHIRIGICYFKIKDYDSASLELNNPVLKKLPPLDYSNDLYLLANSYYRMLEYPNAERAFIEIIEKYPDSKNLRSAKYGLAWCYFQQNHYNDAYKIFNSISEGNDSIAIKSFYWMAESKRYAGEEEEAFYLYKKFIDKYPGSNLIKGVMFQIGAIYFNSKTYNLALQYLENASSDSDNVVRAKSLMLIGEINLDENKYELAIKYFTESINTPYAPENEINRSKLGLGVAYFYEHQYEKAIISLREITSKHPNFERNKVSFYIAESYYSLQKYKEAIKSYNEVDINEREVGSLALYGKAYCYFNMHEYENASKEFSLYITKFPESSRIVDARIRLADSYYGSKNFAASSNIYKEMFKYDRGALDNPYAFYQYAQSLYKANKTADAINEFRALQEKFPHSEYADKSLFVIGWINFQQGNYPEAISDYQNVLNRYPHSLLGADVYYSIGDSYYNLGNYDTAIINYQKVISIYPNSSHVLDAINGIQYCYVAENHPDQAINMINQFVDANPGLHSLDQIYLKKGDIYYSIQDYKNAEDSYKQFIANYPQSKLVPQAYYWVGKSAENLNQNTDALYYFQKVLELFPKSESAPDAVIEMGNIYNVMKDYEDAVQLYDKALTILPNQLRFPEILFNKGLTLENKKDIPSASEVFNSIIQEYNQSIFADKSKLELGIIDLAANQYSDAANYFNDLAQKHTDEIGAEAQYYLGETYFEQNDIQDAVSSLVSVATVFPAYNEWVAKSNLKLGDCYVKLKDYRKAREIYEAVFSSHHADSYGKEARLKIRKLK